MKTKYFKVRVKDRIWNKIKKANGNDVFIKYDHDDEDGDIRYSLEIIPNQIMRVFEDEREYHYATYNGWSLCKYHCDRYWLEYVPIQLPKELFEI